MRGYLMVFLITFLAEMGDKTQISTLLFSSNKEINCLGILAAASCALTLATFFAVVIGSELDRLVSTKTIKVVSGVGFIGIGVWSLLTAK
ncbi:MAG: TMEM165/GDT1 family protein [Deltaproteobacteria bacterium]|nr:TMEM165/GDT1 family protein [Deltaproteobacteria bacterium]